jgi:hypothetical protein
VRPVVCGVLMYHCCGGTQSRYILLDSGGVMVLCVGHGWNSLSWSLAALWPVSEYVGCCTARLSGGSVHQPFRGAVLCGDRSADTLSPWVQTTPCCLVSKTGTLLTADRGHTTAVPAPGLTDRGMAETPSCFICEWVCTGVHQDSPLLVHTPKHTQCVCPASVADTISPELFILLTASLCTCALAACAEKRFGFAWLTLCLHARWHGAPVGHIWG